MLVFVLFGFCFLKTIDGKGLSCWICTKQHKATLIFKKRHGKINVTIIINAIPINGGGK